MVVRPTSPHQQSGFFGVHRLQNLLKVSDDPLGFSRSKCLRRGVQSLCSTQSNDPLRNMDPLGNQSVDRLQVRLLIGVIARNATHNDRVSFEIRHPGTPRVQVSFIARQHKSARVRVDACHRQHHVVQAAGYLVTVLYPVTALAGHPHAVIGQRTRDEQYCEGGREGDLHAST
jgi:hypothetical protein